MSPKALPYISLLATFWGTTLVASRFSVGQYAPLTYVALRVLIAAFCYVIIYAFNRRRKLPRGRTLWRQGMILGIFSTAVPMILIVISLQYQSSGVTALILTTLPALTVVMAHFMLPDEKLTLRKVIGVTLAFSGAALLIVLGENGLPDVREANPTGYIVLLIAIVLASFMVIYTRKNMQDLDSIDVSGVRMWTAAVFVLPLSLLISGFDLSQVTVQGYAAVLYAGLIGTFAGMLLDFYNIKRFGATASAMVSILLPIAAILSGALVLGEAITSGMLLAMALIIGGVWILNTGQQEVVSTLTGSSGLSGEL